LLIIADLLVNIYQFS